MKPIVLSLGAIALFGLVDGPSAAGTITFDEKGNGFFDGKRLDSGKEKEPDSGITTLFYKLPFDVFNGDVIVRETIQADSDVLRFLQNKLYVFSEPPEQGKLADMADNGLPGVRSINSKVISETGPEGMNGATYPGNNPGPMDPGIPRDRANGPLKYNFISDGTAILEPSTFTLLGIGALGLWQYFRRREGA